MSLFAQNSSKRQRISQACEACRRRKSKCDGTQPICDSCASNHRVCTYESSGRRRGLQVGYVRTIETILGLLIRDLPDAEYKLRQLVRSSDVTNSFFLPKFVESTVELWQQSELYEDVQHLLKHHDAGDEGVPDLPGIALRNLPLPTSKTIVSQVISDHATHESVELFHPLISHDEMMELIDWYFTHQHCWFPVVNRRQILHLLHSTKAQSDQRINDSGHKACLSSIAALALVVSMKSIRNGVTVQQMLEAAIFKIDAAHFNFDFGHLQAALILVLTYVALGQVEAAWIRLGQVSRMLISYIGKGPNVADRLPHVMQAWECLDVLTSTVLGKPTSWLERQSPSIFLDETEAEEWELWRVEYPSNTSLKMSKTIPLRALSVFNYTTQLMRQLKPILITDSYEIELRSVLLGLQTWKDALPQWCRFDGPIFVTPCLAGLSLSYNFTLLSVILHARCPADQASIVKQAAQNILDALRSHTDVEGFAQPFLSIYAGHTIRCLGDFQSRNQDPEIRQLIERLHDVRLAIRLWRAENASTQTGAQVDFDLGVGTYPQSVNKTYGIDQTTNWLLAFSPYEPGVIQRVSLENDSSDAIPSESRHLEQPLNTDASNTNAHSTMNYEHNINNLFDNEFDALLDDISFNQDTTGAPTLDFAHNLGFLTEDLDPDLLTALGSGHTPICP